MMEEMIENSSPILLEPIMDVEVSSPSSYQKEVMNDIIKGRRVIEYKIKVLFTN